MYPMRPPTPEIAAPGQESVWAYPRPPRVEQSDRQIVIILGDQTVADTRRAWRVLETSHPPAYYIPTEDIRMDLLEPADGSSYCEWKGAARYWSVRSGARFLDRVGWSYPDPSPGFEPIRGHIAFYAAPFDAVTVDSEQVLPQPGGFYGGWVTSDIVGPFKGIPGSMGW